MTFQKSDGRPGAFLLSYYHRKLFWNFPEKDSFLSFKKLYGVSCDIEIPPGRMHITIQALERSSSEYRRKPQIFPVPYQRDSD